ncbi:alpha/beta fold hydrolase [Sphingomonas sp.]|uniref:alpha/beta fold hydrolase n=1 Tax=Sphingomonas sp. TaxID=28214 RepID=UPI003B00B607
MAGSARFIDGWWQSPDGLRLHYRDYPGDPSLVPLLCLPGLSRNARDFEPVACRLSPGRRVIAAELRGRGESGYAPDPATYALPHYVVDLEVLLIELALPRFVIVGTSLGGILAVLLTSADPARVAGVVLNDIGPVVEAAGLARIRGYVGKGASWPTWIHAARDLADMQRDIHPGYGLEDWLGTAKRLCRLTPTGRIVFDYDMRIAEPMRAPDIAPPPDLWPVFESLVGRPVLLIRGETSDILSRRTATTMAERLRDLDVATVPATGHAPTLAEPVAAAAIDRLLARADAAAATSG